jgi:KaiC/GvpD/RAD55 family RecA-like ATPase
MAANAYNADIRGLPMALGGEIRTVSKITDQAESAVILVRGPAGSGKTIFTTHLAAHEALVRGGDILYCCSELLPTELDAQLSGLTFGREQRPLRVGNLPFSSATNPALKPRIFASIVDVPDTGAPDLGAELLRAMGDAREARLEPRVIVIDSLAEGYRLVGSMPRYLADALSKFAAEQAIVLILIEEVMGSSDSIWTFVADVVLELAHHGMSGTAAAEQRSLTIRKNRFGPSHVGPHPFVIQPAGGIEVHPRLGAYLSEWARRFLPNDVARGPKPQWKLTGEQRTFELPHGDEVILVTGEDASLVAIAAEYFTEGSSVLRLDMSSASPSQAGILRCGNPVLGAERLVSDYCLQLEQLAGRVGAIVIGDLEAIERNIDPDGLRRALPVLLAIGRSAGMAIVLFETAARTAPLSIHLAGTILRVVTAQSKTIVAQLSSHSRVRRRAVLNVRVDIPLPR